MRDFRGPALLGVTLTSDQLTYTGLLPSTVRLPRRFDFIDHFLLVAGMTVPAEWPHNTVCATPVSYHTHTVWPHPLSLATTHGITFVFFSYGY